MNKKPKEFPTRINVMGLPFRIQIVKDLETLEGCVGLTKGDVRIIQICDSLDTRRKWFTLIHEVVHASLHAVGLGNELDELVEEVIAQTTEHTMEQFMDQVGPLFSKDVLGEGE